MPNPDKEINMLTNALLALIATVMIVEAYERKKVKRKKKKNRSDVFLSSLSVYEGTSLLFTIKGKLKIMALKLTDTQQATGTISFVDKKGSPTDVPDGNVTITSSDTAIADVSYDDSKNEVKVVAGKSGVAALHIDAKDSKGNSLPFEDVAVEVTSGDAVSGTITFGEPTEQP